MIKNNNNIQRDQHAAQDMVLYYSLPPIYTARERQAIKDNEWEESKNHTQKVSVTVTLKYIYTYISLIRFTFIVHYLNLAASVMLLPPETHSSGLIALLLAIANQQASVYPSKPRYGLEHWGPHAFLVPLLPCHLTHVCTCDLFRFIDFFVFIYCYNNYPTLFNCHISVINNKFRT